MPHHRTLAPPARTLTQPGAQTSNGVPVIHAELERHYDALYDLLLHNRPARDARPVLDVGTGDGLALSAIVQGTPLHGVGVDRGEIGQWFGPPEWNVLRADAQRLPFDDAYFRSALMVDVYEWLRHPTATLSEIARVTAGPILIVQTDWEGLWFQADKAEVGRELVRSFTRGAPDRLRQRIAESAEEAGLQLERRSTVSITADRIEQGNLAWDVLESIRRYLVIESAQVRARRYDDWRAELQDASEAGQFSMLVRRVVALLNAGD